LGFSQLLPHFIASWTNLKTLLGAIARVKSFTETTPSEFRSDDIEQPPESWPEEGEIEIEDVSVSYTDGTYAVNNISTRISPGEKIEVRGRTSR
jgi:ABC-type multidrug transport system fused ATPase/permease subunit